MYVKYIYILEIQYYKETYQSLLVPPTEARQNIFLKYFSIGL